MSYSINDLIYIDRDTGDTSFTGNILPIGSNQFSLGSSNLPWKDMYLSGNMHSETVTTSNLVVLNAYSTDYQIAPIRQVYYITSTPRSTFTLTTNGYFGGNACNVHIFVDNKKLTYYSETLNNYQLAVSYDYANDKTDYTVTLTNSAVFGNLVDITIWPHILKESIPNPLRLYQYVNIEYSAPITRPYQLPPIRQVFYVSSESQSIFDVITPGAYGGSVNNIQVFVGQSLLSYYSPTATDYTMSISRNTTDTTYTITLTNPVQYASVVDIMIWPTIISGSTLVGSIYQTVTTTSQWQPGNGSDIYYYTTGNVGIGTDNPNQGKLVVGGNILTSGNVIANNNIGIGTTNPTSALHVIGNVLATGTITASNISVIGDFVTMNTVTSNTEQIVITNAGTGPALKVTQTGDQSVAEFYDNESGIALYVGNNGNVGVGTTDPQATFNIRANTSSTGVIIDQVGTGSILDIKDGGISKVIVDTNGNVGVGTATPQVKLDVNGIIQTNQGIVMCMNTSNVDGGHSVHIFPAGCQAYSASAPGIPTAILTPLPGIGTATGGDGGTLYVNPTAIYQFWRTYINLVAGTYSFRLMYGKAADRGIVSVVINNISYGTIDMYSTTALYGVGIVTGISIPTSGVYKLELQVNSKNASASNYIFCFLNAGMIRIS